MPTLKVVRIVTRMNVGGPSTHIRLLHQLDPRRFRTCLVVGRPETAEGDRAGWVQDGANRVIRIGSLRRSIRPLLDLLALAQILRILWRERPEILHTHMAKAGTLGRLAGWLYNRVGPGRTPGRCAVLVHTFHGHVLEGYFPRWISHLFTCWERWLAARTDCLIAVSPAIRRDLLERGVGRNEQWRVVPVGLDLTALKPLPPANGARSVRCGLVGRLVPIKNPQLFLDAVERVVRRSPAPALRAAVIGDGPLRPQMEAAVRARRLGESFSFTGWCDDLASCYRELDVVCLTSWNEGTPLSVIEGMAAGRAAVASDVGGVRDLLEPPPGCPAELAPGQHQICRRGILFRAGDAEGLAGALVRLIEEPSLRHDLGQAGRAYALEQFAHPRLMEEISGLYERLSSSVRGRK